MNNVWNEKGQGLIEYAFLIVLIAILVMVIVIVLGNSIENMYLNLATHHFQK